MLRLIILPLLLSVVSCVNEVYRARAYIFKASKNGYPTEIAGIIDFEQSGVFLKLNGSVEGLPDGPHGFHIHEKGDIGSGCVSAGPHYNPHRLTHGGPDDSNRHIGDLGNVLSTNGTSKIAISDTLASLTGTYSIIGRAIVIHEKADDLGRGTSDVSKTTGDAGSRLACGVIGQL